MELNELRNYYHSAKQLSCTADIPDETLFTGNAFYLPVISAVMRERLSLKERAAAVMEAWRGLPYGANAAGLAEAVHLYDGVRQTARMFFLAAMEAGADESECRNFIDSLGFRRTPGFFSEAVTEDQVDGIDTAGDIMDGLRGRDAMLERTWPLPGETAPGAAALAQRYDSEVKRREDNRYAGAATFSDFAQTEYPVWDIIRFRMAEDAAVCAARREQVPGLRCIGTGMKRVTSFAELDSLFPESDRRYVHACAAALDPDVPTPEQYERPIQEMVPFYKVADIYRYITGRDFAGDGTDAILMPEGLDVHGTVYSKFCLTGNGGFVLFGLSGTMDVSHGTGYAERERSVALYNGLVGYLSENRDRLRAAHFSEEVRCAMTEYQQNLESMEARVLKDAAMRQWPPTRLFGFGSDRENASKVIFRDSWKEKMDGAVESARRVLGIGRRLDLPGGESVRINLAYQRIEGRPSALPVLTCTVFDGSTAYEERHAFRPDGTFEEWGIAYPQSETGVTGLDRYIGHNEDILLGIRQFRAISEALSEWAVSADLTRMDAAVESFYNGTGEVKKRGHSGPGTPELSPLDGREKEETRGGVVVDHGISPNILKPCTREPERIKADRPASRNPKESQGKKLK